MKAKIQKTIVLELSELQAHYLCNLMQNPVGNVEDRTESQEFKDLVRRPLFETLKETLNYGVR